MTILFYNKNSRIAISSDPFFPQEEELDEKGDMYKEPLKLEEWNTYYIKFYGDKVRDFSGNVPFHTKTVPGKII